MTVFQLLMLGASAFFAFKIYEHIQTLQEPEQKESGASSDTQRTANAFSTFSPEALVERADSAYEEKDFTKALALLNEADAKEKNNPDHYQMAFDISLEVDNVEYQGVLEFEIE